MTTWTPLESNPEVMTKYIHRLGVPSKWNIVDVYGLESEMLEWVPKPVKAVILLFPCSKPYEKQRVEEEEKLKANPPKYPDDLFFMKQVIQNACGSIALVHSIANNPDIELEEGLLKKYLEATKSLSPDERGRILEGDSAFTGVHQEIAQEGQTTANPDEEVFHHFVALVNKDGQLYELDGRKSSPIAHGATSADTFLQDAAKVCKEFMARDPEEVRFTVIALTPKAD
uniref:Ubiquitin carboxyl-terminal hydrolase n=1 Tax=Tabanus bromius TaxID=304241 RepID=A0A0K8TT99_TABBR